MPLEKENAKSQSILIRNVVRFAVDVTSKLLSR